MPQVIREETAVQAEVQNLPVLSVAEILHQFPTQGSNGGAGREIMVQVAEAVQHRLLKGDVNLGGGLGGAGATSSITGPVARAGGGGANAQSKWEQAVQVEAVTQAKVVVVQARQTQVVEVQVQIR